MLEQGWCLNFGSPTPHFTSVYENPCPIYHYFYSGRRSTTPVNYEGRGARTRLGSVRKRWFCCRSSTKKNGRKKPRCVDYAGEDTMHMSQRCVQLCFSRFSSTPRAKPSLLVILEAENQATTSDVQFVPHRRVRLILRSRAHQK